MVKEPRCGCATSTTISLAASEASSMISLVERIGPHGMLWALSRSRTSHLGSVEDHSSISWNILPSLGRRASGVAHSASSASSGRPMSSVSGCQPTGCTITYT